MARPGDTTTKLVPMISVPDIGAALDWYTSMGFTEKGRFEEDGVVNFGLVALGQAEIMFRVEAWGAGGHFQRSGHTGPHDVSLWLYTNDVDDLYQFFRSHPAIEFAEDIYDPFYGGRQFSIRDLHGYTLVFYRED